MMKLPQVTQQELVPLSVSAKRFLMSQRVHDIAIAQLRCQINPFSEIQGFSGQPIDCFPPTRFFRLYICDQVRGKELFCSWLRYCLVDMQAWQISRCEGGWMSGSLMRIVVALHQKNGMIFTDMRSADPALVDAAIRLRVERYFQLFESIRRDGFDRACVPPILVESIDRDIYIRDGHHRCAILSALGQTVVPVAFWEPHSVKALILAGASRLCNYVRSKDRK